MTCKRNPLPILITAIILWTIPPLSAQMPTLGSNIYSPILVTGTHLVASGVYWMHNSNLYFVTAKHVVLNDTGGLVSQLITLTSSAPSKDGFQNAILKIDMARLLRNGEIHAHKTHDITIIRLGSYEEKPPDKLLWKFPPAVTVEAFPDSGISCASAITTFNSAVISNDAFVLGYPAAIGVPEVPQIDYSQPLARKGIVAGKNFVKHTLIVDCPVYPGNSGGPVFEVDEVDLGKTMRLIGVVSEWIPFREEWQNHPFGYENQQMSNSGYTVVEPADLILELAEEAK